MTTITFGSIRPSICTSIWLIFLSLLVSQAFATATPLTIKHYQSNHRYAFGHELLELALSKVNEGYTIETHPNESINEARGESMLRQGLFDVQWLSYTKARASDFIVIRIPIYRGILGLRLLLVSKAKQHALDHVKSLTDLQAFTGGHGTHWGDLSVYSANNLPVYTYPVYEPLFLQLANHRFDYFHRGLNEIWKEQSRHKDTLVVADNIMLYYPHPIYFMINKNKPELAQHIQQGLEVALKDGSYRDLFDKHHGEDIVKGALTKRTRITLINPELPNDTPPIDTHWWLPE